MEYPSATVGTTRKTQVYTPPGYNPNEKYPVLYLLHGIGGDEWEWKNGGTPEVILDNLYAAKKLQPMIVVLPETTFLERHDELLARDGAYAELYRTQFQDAAVS